MCSKGGMSKNDTMAVLHQRLLDGLFDGSVEADSLETRVARCSLCVCKREKESDRWSERGDVTCGQKKTTRQRERYAGARSIYIRKSASMCQFLLGGHREADRQGVARCRYHGCTCKLIRHPVGVARALVQDL
jgi:hypothetical protein